MRTVLGAFESLGRFLAMKVPKNLLEFCDHLLTKNNCSLRVDLVGGRGRERARERLMRMRQTSANSQLAKPASVQRSAKENHSSNCSETF